MFNTNNKLEIICVIQLTGTTKQNNNPDNHVFRFCKHSLITSENIL